MTGRKDIQTMNTLVGESKANKFKKGLVFVCVYVCYDTFPLRCVEQCHGAECSKRGLTGCCFASLLKTESHPRGLL